MPCTVDDLKTNNSKFNIQYITVGKVLGHHQLYFRNILMAIPFLLQRHFSIYLIKNMFKIYIYKCYVVVIANTPHDLYKIILICCLQCVLLSMLRTAMLLNIFVETMIHLFIIL